MNTKSKINEFIGENIKSIIFVVVFVITNYYIVTSSISDIKAEVTLKTSEERIIGVVKKSINIEGTYFPNVEGQVLKEQIKQLKENNEEFKRLLEKLEDKIR